MRKKFHPSTLLEYRETRESLRRRVSLVDARDTIRRTNIRRILRREKFLLPPAGEFSFSPILPRYFYFRKVLLFSLSLSLLSSFSFPPYSRHPHPSNDLTARLSIIAKYNIYIYIYIVSQRERHILGEKSWEILGDRLADPLFIVDWNSKTATPRRGISLKLWLGYWNAAQVRAWRLVYGTWIDSARSLSWHASTCGMYTCSHTRAFVTAPLYNAGLSQRFAVPFRNRWTDIATSL